ncbi:MAG: hypothetical protein ACRDTF_17655, partial [Pseudonocardiaceae bacterium]
LTPQQRAVLDQVTVCRAPMRLEDLAYALTEDPPQADPHQTPAADLTDLDADIDRLTDLTLLTTDPGIAMHPWTADLLEHRAPDLTDQHQRALAMRMRRITDGVADYLDLLDIPRHHAALGQYDDLAAVAEQVTQVLPGTLAVAAYLAEIRPLIPPTERAWALVADLELTTFLAIGDLSSAVRLADAFHHNIETRAAADPTNTAWQRDLSISHNKLGDLAVAAGDLATAQNRFQTGLTIAERLAAMDPANAQWRSDLAYVQQRMADLVNSSGKGAVAQRSPGGTPDASPATSSSGLGSRITGVVASLFRPTRRRP